MTQGNIGILNPGEMGISIATSIQNAQHSVYWASAGRSAETIKRAGKYKLIDAENVANLCEQCEIIVSVCPPEAASEVANQVIENGYSGLYLDANAISPHRSEDISRVMTSAGIKYVDGGIIGPPAWNAGTTHLYLSGTHANKVSTLFESGPLSVHILGDNISDASALKMCFAAYTKSSTALLCSILAVADNLGVREALYKQWSFNDPDFAVQAENRVRGNTKKAWRFVAELEEIASTFEATGVPGGAQSTAAEIYRRLAHFKDTNPIPDLREVISSITLNDKQPSRSTN